MGRNRRGGKGVLWLYIGYIQNVHCDIASTLPICNGQLQLKRGGKEYLERKANLGGQGDGSGYLI